MINKPNTYRPSSINKKKCKKCNKKKDISNFHKNGNYYRSKCKKCNNKEKSKRDKKDVEDLKNYYVVRKIKHILGNDFKPTKDLIDIYRLNIKLKRELNRWKSTKNT